jgi:alkanesulfonate monooxygenase SsuD/methylene tetrahydromethanopterin reductase-like flavin-dependent oxidoreductase (luciferase family)
MKIGIGLPNGVRDVRPTVIPEGAVAAEEAGFSTVGTLGRVAYPGVMDTVALAAAAGATRRIGLMSTITLGTVWPASLFAKEAASIDGVSGNRLTLGLGVGTRPDDFVVPGLGMDDRGRRLDEDLETYEEIWDAEPVGGGHRPAVPTGTRQVPLLFGGQTPRAFARMARWGKGYVSGAVPPSLAAMGFEFARTAWREEGRYGDPYLVAIAYFALADPDTGRENIGDYHAGKGIYTDMVVKGVADGPARLRTVVKEFQDIGADELILSPATDELEDVRRLAEIVL